jgi:hypothetical protein
MRARLLWFAALYLAGIAVVGGIALLLRAVLPN